MTAKQDTSTGGGQLSFLSSLSPLDTGEEGQEAQEGHRDRDRPVSLTPWSSGAPALNRIRAGTRHWRRVSPRLTDDALQADLERRAGGDAAAAAFAAWTPAKR